MKRPSGRVGCLIVLAILILAGTRGCPRPGMLTRQGTKVMPSIDATRRGVIDAVDFTVDDERILHLIWHVRIGDNHSSYVESQQVWYRRCDLRSDTWGAPHLLASGRDDVYGPPRIVRTGDTLHVIVPYQLTHFVSGDSGSTWNESTPMLSPNSYIAQYPDVAVDGDSIILAYASRKKGDPVEGALFVSTWCHGAAGSDVVLRKAELDAIVFAKPHLNVVDGTRHVFLAVNHPHTWRGVLSHWQSIAGDGWSPPDSSQWPEEVYHPPNSSTVYEYAAANVGSTCVAFAGNWALHCITWRLGESTRVSRTVAEVPDRWLSADRRTSMIQTAFNGHGGQVIWVDTRFGRTDRTPLNPLGGIPWSDAPDWPNNDVFALPIEKILQAGDDAGHLVPLRLTRDLSVTQCLRAHTTSRSVYAVWAGIPRYHRGSNAETPQSIWYTTLPLY